jgi:hypothetical protein
MVIFQKFNFKKEGLSTHCLVFFSYFQPMYIYIQSEKKCHNDYGSRRSDDNGKICYYDQKYD